jgi:hypothetical protein
VKAGAGTQQQQQNCKRPGKTRREALLHKVPHKNYKIPFVFGNTGGQPQAERIISSAPHKLACTDHALAVLQGNSHANLRVKNLKALESIPNSGAITFCNYLIYGNSRCSPLRTGSSLEHTHSFHFDASFQKMLSTITPENEKGGCAPPFSEGTILLIPAIQSR